MNRCIQLGKPFDPNTMQEGRAIIRKVTEQWGNEPLSRLTVEEIGKYLFSLDRSGNYKRTFFMPKFIVAGGVHAA
ncbi:MAG: hypothetical protein LBF60_06485 [Treponema sp.]|nr:hypothetical protein [Treponema sp.]